MLQAFDYYNYTGLERYIVDVAKRESHKPGVSWQLIIGDFEKQTGWVYLLLHLLPPAVIRSVIRNTLPYDKIHDPEVNDFFNDYMVVRAQNPCAGVYIQWVANTAGVNEDPAVMAKNGKFLTSRQVEQMLDCVDGYLVNGPSSERANIAIDRAFNPGFPATTPNQRGKSITGDTLKKVQDWMKIMRRQYCDGIDTSKADEQFLRTPMEVGWSQNVPSRIKDHDQAGSTTVLLYLVRAIAKKVFPLTIKSHALLFPIPYDGEFSLLYSTAEVLASILLSSYHFHGGLNAAFAGGSNTITLKETDNVWWLGARYFIQRLELRHVSSEVRNLKRQFELLSAAQKLQSSREEYEAAKAEYEAIHQKRDAKLAEYRAAQKNSRQRREEFELARGEQAAAEVEDGPLAELDRMEQKKRIWAILGDCIYTEDDEMAEVMAEDLHLFDADILLEATEEYKEADERGRKEADEEFERRRTERERGREEETGTEVERGREEETEGEE